MQRFVGLFVAAAVAVAGMWWWLGQPVAGTMAASDPGRIQCMSYSPFRDSQSPLDPKDRTTRVEPSQIEEDLAKLSRLTGCVRTYSIEKGLDQVPAIAQRLGMKVIQGLWLSRDRERNRVEIDATVTLAQRYPDAIIAVVVGNEVLLRGELSAADIGAVLREVKAKVAMPVTYADVWEFWLRNRDLLQAVDFITIHILPYWEDFPIAAERAGEHVDQIRAEVAAALPGKEILIGEVGWPSAGRMREGALPSPANQALVLEDVMARARAGHYRVNVIEAFDQPWKRQLEGTVGGRWGLLTSDTREPKFAWNAPVSDHPAWAWQLAGGVALAGLIFAGAGVAGGRDIGKLPRPAMIGIAVIAVAAGVTAPWAFANVAIESLGFGGWVRGIAFAVVALAAPATASLALAKGVAVPGFARVLGGAAQRPPVGAALLSGLVLVATSVLALQTALGLVFDPRYRDFTFAPLTAAIVPFAAASLVGPRGAAPRGLAETIAAVTLLGSAVYIVLNEGFANWQALWFSGLLMVLAVTLWRLRDAQSTE